MIVNWVSVGGRRVLKSCPCDHVVILMGFAEVSRGSAAVCNPNSPHPFAQYKYHWIATRSSCYRGPKPQNSPKWSGESAKGVLANCRKGLPRVSCTSATLFCTSASLFCTSLTGFWSTYAKTPFAPSPSHFGNFEVSGLCSRHFGSQPLDRKPYH